MSNLECDCVSGQKWNPQWWGQPSSARKIVQTTFEEVGETLNLWSSRSEWVLRESLKHLPVQNARG